MERDTVQAVYRVLDESGIRYRRLNHRAVYTMEEMRALAPEDFHAVAKNLFLRDSKGKRHSSS